MAERRRLSPRTVVALVAVSIGAAMAYARRWTADDAFISFRYARNLVEGHGLVYNVGERVEGYTNLLWTLLCSIGLALGASAEAVAHVLGIASYTALIGLLAARRTGWPVAAVVAACHPDLWVYATSGLETALFMLLSTAGLAWCLAADSARGRYGAGALLGLCVLTRPDGMIFALVGLAAAALGSPPKRRVAGAAQVGAVVVLLAGSQLAFRLAYYGELLPNTFHAKSAGRPWYGQGLRYLGFFLQRSWVLVVAALVAAVVAIRARGESEARPGLRQAAVYAAAALLYAAFVIHVGGDFMFARLLLPAVPPLLLAIERATCGRERAQLVLGPLAALALALSPLPSAEVMWGRGIVDERSFPDPMRDQPGRAATLRRFFSGLDVRVAFTGGDARLMYRARIPVAIESETGLTDRTIARRELSERGRVGHEKHASLEYLVRERNAHFTFRKRALAILNVPERLPLVEVRFGDVRGYCLHWDRDLMRELTQRGARVHGFEDTLDAIIARIDSFTELELRRLYEKLELFYFAHNDDPARRAPFTERLAPD